MTDLPASVNLICWFSLNPHSSTPFPSQFSPPISLPQALFRALKTKHETPKYGLIFHASLIGQAPPKLKGKVARVLAAKCSLAIRCDALGEASDASLGIESRAKVRGVESSDKSAT